MKRINNYGLLEEDVYETAHLEILPPRQRSAVQDLSSQDADGLWRIACLNSKRTILLYNNDLYWNRKLKANFINSVPLNLSRNSISGTKVTMDITAKSNPNRMPDGEKKYLTPWSSKLFPANDRYNQSTRMIDNYNNINPKVQYQ